MSDEHPSDDRAAASAPDANAAAPDRADDAPRRQEPSPDALPPAQALAKGLGLLFQAAVGAAGSVKESVERGAVNHSISEAGRHLEGAATAALRGLESLVRSVTAPPAHDGANSPRADEARPQPGVGEEPSRAAEEASAEPAGVDATTDEPEGDAAEPAAPSRGRGASDAAAPESGDGSAEPKA